MSDAELDLYELNQLWGWNIYISNNIKVMQKHIIYRTCELPLSLSLSPILCPAFKPLR